MASSPDRNVNSDPRDPGRLTEIGGEKTSPKNLRDYFHHITQHCMTCDNVLSQARQTLQRLLGSAATCY